MSSESPADVTFADLELHPAVLKAVQEVGYETPSPIQAQTIPALLDGHDVVGLAATGTGKTAAFALPVLSRIDPKLRRPQALVLAPTRELALQVSEAFGRYASKLPQVSVVCIYGGGSYPVQLQALGRGAQVVVGTPGRVVDHLERGTLKLDGLKFLVLDEADEMLKMGFQEDVERVLASASEDKQVALFSATMPGAIRKISKTYLRNPVEVTVKSATTTSENIEQRYTLVAHHRKLDLLTRILEVEPFSAMIVFVRTKQATEELAERLRSRGFTARPLNGDIAQSARERTVSALREGKIDILVATDVAARGLDVERISHVFNYDAPHDTESYVHRIGRTGRAGRTGVSYLFVTPRERSMINAIERATRQPLAEAPLPTVADVNAGRIAKFRDSITEALSLPGVEQFRRLVEDYERENDVPMADIAAALAAQTRSGEEFLLSEDQEDFQPKKGPRGEYRDDRGGRESRGGGQDGRRSGFHKRGPGGFGSRSEGFSSGGSGRRDFGGRREQRGGWEPRSGGGESRGGWEPRGGGDKGGRKGGGPRRSGW
ncbi:MAG: DEAD/DEAH box helicase [Segniliparus sp.]|uniref:DEAD/DEAH box helicase n=1 Tax=Segniliparus sp. TaxID=2804064 RepID=UPI003F37419E